MNAFLYHICEIEFFNDIKVNPLFTGRLLELINFHLDCISKLDEVSSLDQLDDFYDWLFNEYKNFDNNNFIWSDKSWKKISDIFLKKYKKCSKCGSSSDLLVQHVVPFPGKFLYFSNFYSHFKHFTWQKYRKFRKIKGVPTEKFVFYFYKLYLRSYFKSVIDYFTFKNVKVYCKSCAFKEDYNLVFFKGNRYYVPNDNFYHLIANFYYRKNTKTPEERP